MKTLKYFKNDIEGNGDTLADNCFYYNDKYDYNNMYGVEAIIGVHYVSSSNDNDDGWSYCKCDCDSTNCNCNCNCNCDCPYCGYNNNRDLGVTKYKSSDDNNHTNSAVATYNESQGACISSGKSVSSDNNFS